MEHKEINGVEENFKRRKFATAIVIEQFKDHVNEIYGFRYYNVSISCINECRFAINCLDNKDSNIQSIAIKSFSTIWEINDEAMEKLLELAKSPALRRTALAALSSNADKMAAKHIIIALLKRFDSINDKNDKYEAFELYHAIIIQSVLINSFSISFTEVIYNYLRYINNEEFYVKIDFIFLQQLKTVISFGVTD